MYISLLSHNAGKRDFTFSDLGVIMQVCRLEKRLSKIKNAKINWIALTHNKIVES